MLQVRNSKHKSNDKFNQSPIHNSNEPKIRTAKMHEQEI